MDAPGRREIASSWRLVEAIRSYANGFTAVFDRHFGTDYIDDGQLLALEYLASRGPATVPVLAEVTGLDRGQALSFVRDLTGRGLVTSERSAQDRRQRVYRLTAAGERAAARTAADLSAFYAEATALAAEVVSATQARGPEHPAADHGSDESHDAWSLARGVALVGLQLTQEIVARLGAEREGKVHGRRILAVIVVCAEADCRPSTIAAELGLSPAGATYLIDVLERDGLVTRERDIEGDRRGVRVVATAEGLAAAVAVHDALQEIAPLLHAQFSRLSTHAART
ncbi:MarR family winged helix-turn-helix transcriptional regulator [Demequina pelophila]|uniref:MarR family winged helix-turn-helix transcriptional regulator n=1 Tax=Demequina pelophila TaxID=1638984 RepID=UPI0007837FD1|nr:MarR family transcriptional regulator [Demequina pelophila]